MLEARENVLEENAGNPLPEIKPQPRTIRVALNAISDLGSKYGSYVYLIELARALARTREIDLMLLVGQGAKKLLPKELRAHAYEIAVPTSGSYWQILYQRRIQNALLREKVDVYHLPNTLPFLWRAVPTVVSIHDVADLRLRKYGWSRTSYRTLINYCAARLSDHVLTLSENSKNDISALLRIPKDKVKVTFAGVDSRFQVLDRSTCREKVRDLYNIDSEYILAPGGFSRNKNVLNLLSAFAQLRGSHPWVKLVLTGYGTKSEKRDVFQAIENLALRDSVIFTGYVDGEEMPSLYGACSVVVYPSYYEGFGLPAVEAMASGCPLVVADRSSLPEVTGDAALSVNPDDPAAIASATRRLLDDQQLRDKLVAQGLVRAKHFSWQRTATRVIEVYRTVLSESQAKFLPES